jgi:hypothetical protein
MRLPRAQTPTPRAPHGTWGVAAALSPDRINPVFVPELELSGLERAPDRGGLCVFRHPQTAAVRYHAGVQVRTG